jgi:hypothetical protein
MKDNSKYFGENIKKQLATYGEGSRQVTRLATRINDAVRLQGAWQRQLQQTNERLGELNRPMNQFATRLRGISERAQESGKKMKELGKNISASFGAMTLAVGTGLGVTAKKAMDFEAQMSSVKSVMDPEAANKYGKALENLAITMGAKTKYSATEAAQGIEELVKSGVSVTDIINGGLDGALSLATAGELELKDAAEIASTALNAFKDDNLSVARAADILAGAANASATDVGEMKFGLSAVAAVASGVGLNFMDTSTALAAFAQNGLKGQDAGTSLKTMLLNLSPHTKAAAEMMDSLNLGATNAAAGFNWLVDKGMKPAIKPLMLFPRSLMKLAKQQAGAGASAGKIAKEYDKLAKYSGFASSAFYDNNGNLKSMSEIAGTLQKALKDLNSEQRQNALQTMFGTDAIRAGNILYKEGAKGIKDMASAMNKIKASDVAKTKLDNLKGTIEQLKGSLETAAISLGEALLPAIKAVTQVVQGMVDKFNSLPTPVQHFIAIAGGVAVVLGAIVTAAGFLLIGIGGLMESVGALGLSIAAAAETAGGFGALLAGIATGPVGIIVGALAGAGWLFML